MFSFNSMASTNCLGLAGCERKFCELEYQIERAEQSNNQYKVDGLRKALSAAKSHCTDESLKTNLLNKIRKTEQKISKYRSRYHEAIEAGDSSKELKYKEKIIKQENKLDKLQKELSDFS